jgi:hypothetical protein
MRDQSGKSRIRKQRDRVMATMVSTTLSSPAMRRDGDMNSSGVKGFFRRFFIRAFDPYRPELHYMRGPGPAWRAKYGDQASFRLKSGNI